MEIESYQDHYRASGLREKEAAFVTQLLSEKEVRDQLSKKENQLLTELKRIKSEGGRITRHVQALISHGVKNVTKHTAIGWHSIQVYRVENELACLKKHLLRCKRAPVKTSGLNFSELKAKAKGVQIYELLGIPLCNQKQVMTKCPFHEEKTASFCVYFHTNSFYCFGCGKGGDPIAFAQELYGVGFKEAVLRLTSDN